jgi:hypothetical protein
MSNLIYRLAARSSVTILLIASFILMTATAAAAFDGPENKPKESPAQATGSTPAATEATEATARIAHTAFAAEASAQRAPAAPTPEAAFTRAMTSKSTALSAAVVAALPRISTAPMSAGEKFDMFVRGSFMPTSVVQPIASGLFNELLDNNEGKEDTLDDYFADAMTRAARSYAFRVTSNFFEKFAYPTILRQDPRYHRSGKTGTGARIGYAISRLFVTRGDRGGDQPNVSFLAGGLTAAAISNVWVREEHQNVSHTFRRWGIHIALRGVSNIFREFLSGQ